MQTPSPATGEVVILLGDDLEPVGTAPKADVHTSATPLHLAFSLYLFDEAGRVLMTRRALGKKTWPGVWSNACCGHPAPGESMEAAVARRLRQEVGVGVTHLTEVLPHFQYRAVDASGVVENEFCPVFAGLVDGDPAVDPSEIMELTWVAWEDVRRTAAGAAALLSPWCVDQVGQLGDALPERVLEARR